MDEPPSKMSRMDMPSEYGRREESFRQSESFRVNRPESFAMQLNDDVNRLTSFREFDSGFNRPQQFNSEFNRPQQFGRETFSEFRDRYVMERGSNFGNQYGKFGNFNNSFETSFGNMGNSRRNPWGFEQQRPQGGFNQQ